MGDVKRIKVTRNGQTTIPKELRRKFGIHEGSVLLAEATKKGVLFRPVPDIEDLAGSLSKYASPEEVKKALDRARAEED
jgi:AbrB family looped-hinge helix DNA binding protein